MTEIPRYIKDLPLAREADRQAKAQRNRPDVATLGFALGFHLEHRAGTWVLQYAGQGCRPATDAEVALWEALQRAITAARCARR